MSWYKQSQVNKTENIVFDIYSKITNNIEGSWTVTSDTKKMPTYQMQSYRIITMDGKNVKKPGDYFWVEVKMFTYKALNILHPWDGTYERAENWQQGVKSKLKDLGGNWKEEEKKRWEALKRIQPEDSSTYDDQYGNKLIEFYVLIYGKKPDGKEPPTSFNKLQEFFGKGDMEKIGSIHKGIDTPSEIVQYVQSVINNYYSEDNDGGEENFPSQPYIPLESINYNPELVNASMNWYKKIIYAQIWETDTDDSFEEVLQSFYELEYKYQSLKNFPFTGMPQRYENILEKVKDSLEDSMLKLKDVLVATFNGWLESHALTDPAQWAKKRMDPYGTGAYDYIESIGAGEALGGVVGEYLDYKHNKQMHNENIEQGFSEMLSIALKEPEKYPSLQGLSDLYLRDQEERYNNELYDVGFETFGENYVGQAFESEEAAETWIEEQIENFDLSEHVYDTGMEDFISSLQYSGMSPEQFIQDLNQNLVFPMWMDYWGAMGIEGTREMAEEAYEGLVSANSFEEFHQALEVAIQTCHQNGSMLEYLEQYGGEYNYSSPEMIEITMLELTEGKSNSEWDKQLKEIGVKIPLSVRKYNLEVAKT